MDIDLTLRNYRCFTLEAPATFQFRPGRTAFLGANNSGKSTLLRSFYELRPLYQSLTSADSWHYLLLGKTLIVNAQGIRDVDDIHNQTNDQDAYITISLRDESMSGANFQPITSARLTLKRGTQQLEADVYSGSEHIEWTENCRFEENILSCGSALYDFSSLLDACRILSDTMYIGPFRNALNANPTSQYLDINFGLQVITLWDSLKNGDQRQHQRLARELCESIRCIFGFDAFDLDRHMDGSTLRVTVNNQSFRLEELGSGLAQFIIVFINVITKRPRFILIDEPELNLHPTLQMDFLSSLESFAIDGILFATHSLGLARASADRIYTIEQSHPGQATIRAFEQQASLVEFLGELSYGAYYDLGYKKILLVEGPSELKVIHQLLRLYHQDHNVVLMHFNGRSGISRYAATELAEIVRLTNDTDVIGVVIDSEKASEESLLEPSRGIFVEICETLQIKCHVLKRSAFENYLTVDAIHKVKSSEYRALMPFEKLADVTSNAWDKTENWRIAREMTREELDVTDLGEFLQDFLGIETSTESPSETQVTSDFAASPDDSEKRSRIPKFFRWRRHDR